MSLLLYDNLENESLQTTNNPANNVEMSRDGIASDALVYWFQVLVLFGIAGFICLAGMGANIINMIVFCRQGALSDSSNTTLLGLAVTDFFCLLTIVGTGTLLFLSLEGPDDLDWNPDGVMMMTTGWPHVMFSQITCWIMAYLTFERCVCVTFPFKVKTMFSAKRSLAFLVTIYAFTAICYTPVFATHSLAWVDDPHTNRTMLSLVRMTHWKEAANASNYFNTIICRTLSAMTVLVCTKITVSKINTSKRWRKSVGVLSNFLPTSSKRKQQTIAHSENNDESVKSSVNTLKTSNPPMSKKETKLVRMITTIATIFLICYTPEVVAIYVRIAIPQIRFRNRYHNLYLVLHICFFFLESINSSINIFIYYMLSSRYRQEFRIVFRFEER